MRVESIRTLEGPLTIQSNQFADPGEFHNIPGVGQQGPQCILPSREPREVQTLLSGFQGVTRNPLVQNSTHTGPPYIH